MTPSSGAGASSTTWCTWGTTCGSGSAACSWPAWALPAARASATTCILAGHVGVTDHLVIGDGARIAAKSAVFGDIPAGASFSGHPARPHRQFLRAQAALYRVAPIISDLERLLPDDRPGSGAMARRTLAGRRGGGRDGPAHGPRRHRALLRRALRAGHRLPPDRPRGLAVDSRAHRRSAVHRAADRPRPGRGLGADRGASARRRGLARPRRHDGRARRAGAADRRRLVHPVSLGPHRGRHRGDAGAAGGVPGA